MDLRETLYQSEVYAPRIESLRAAVGEAGDEAAQLFGEFDRILTRSTARRDEIISEVRDLLGRTRDQLRLLLVERAGEREVARCLLGSRSLVDAAFPERFGGLLESMHGDISIGLIEASHALVESAYFEEATKALREAARLTSKPRVEIDRLLRYAEGMQAFLDGNYLASTTSLEAWVDLSGHTAEPEFAQRAGAALSRLGRLVDNDAEAVALVDQAKQLQLQLETASA